MGAAEVRRIARASWRWALVLAWMGVIFYLSSQRQLPRPKEISSEVEAIAGHFTVYAVLATLVMFALAESGISKTRRFVYAFAFAVLYGVSDEIHQAFVPGRDPDLFDLMVDGIGAMTALFAWALYERWRTAQTLATRSIHSK